MPDPDHPEIYRSQAEQYEALVSREDTCGNLLPAIQAILPVEGIDVVELGAGTGRLTCLLAPLVASIHAYDISQHMLDLAAEKLEASGLHNWKISVSDHRRVPLQDGAADLVISGWSVCYIVVDHPETWRTELGKVMAEVRRLLRPGGTILLIETLGTGFETPHPPEHLLEYYAWLKEQGFQQTWIRTDYRFESLEKARELAEFFFGKEMLVKIAETGDEITLPECTGLWWLKVDGE
jgi:ubiquinone/menaquinone biosynthesis C-methylase UbiE